MSRKASHDATNGVPDYGRSKVGKDRNDCFANFAPKPCERGLGSEFTQSFASEVRYPEIVDVVWCAVRIAGGDFAARAF